MKLRERERERESLYLTPAPGFYITSKSSKTLIFIGTSISRCRLNIRHFRWKGLRGLSWCCGDYDLSALGEVGESGGRSVACRSQVYTKPRHIVYNRRHTLDYTEKSGSVHNFPFVFLSLYHRSPKQNFKRRERAFPKCRMDASAGDYTCCEVILAW